MAEHAPLILTADDDVHLRDLIEHHVVQWGYRYQGVGSGEALMHALDRGVRPAVLLLDIALGDAHGIDLVAPLKELLPAVPIIMITADGSVEAAVQSLKNGAYDFLCKPLDFERLGIEIGKALEQHRLARQVQAYQQANQRSDFHGMIGRSEPMKALYRLIETVSPTDAAVLILGETGTGKELAAQAIHACSTRHQGPFVAVNAPAIPHELIESALFGHEKGAFTGAHQRHVGYCEQADGGTLFLDEIAEMDYNVQAKLLRFLQDHVVQPVGTKTGKTVDVRVVAATNRDPAAQIQANKLREDFYYRLSVITLHLAALRERPGDILLLAQYQLEQAASRYNRPMRTIAPAAQQRLDQYPWPGNIRQMENLINQIVIMHEVSELTVDMLPDDIKQGGSVAPVAPLESPGSVTHALLSIPLMERQLILAALEQTQGVVPQAAKLLELSPATLYRKIKKLGLSRRFAESS
ncbi:sigma-54-dependent transcriptional regulator [Planctomycetota bacterium]